MLAAVRAVLGFLFVCVSALTLLAAAAHADEPHDRIKSVLNDPRLARDRATLDALARDSDAMPAGADRDTLDMFLSAAFRERVADTGRVVHHVARLETSTTASPLLKRVAQGTQVDALLAAGDVSAGLAVAKRSGDADLLGRAHKHQRRARLHVASVALIGLFGAGVALALARAESARRRAALVVARAFLPRALFFAAWLGGAGAVLAASYDNASPLPFVLLAAALVPFALGARAWGAVGRESPRARAGRALVAAPALLAVAYLTLEHLDTSLLGGFGL